jgi:hypothetical protein
MNAWASGTNVASRNFQLEEVSAYARLDGNLAQHHRVRWLYRHRDIPQVAE